MSAPIAPSGSRRARSTLRVVVTVDVHDGDRAEDIAFAAQWLAILEVQATFFVPTAMLWQARYERCLLALREWGHEVGSHGHEHSAAEIRALTFGSAVDLRFLEESRTAFHAFFGHPPRSFRSPAWCRLTEAAFDELARLGYAVDSSCTPGRWSIFTSRPFDPSWSRAARHARMVRPGLLEVPTSTLLLPAASPTFLTLRWKLSRLLLQALALETAKTRNRPLVIQLHADDLNPDAPNRRRRRLRLDDFRLRADGGLCCKYFLRATQGRAIATMSQTIVRTLTRYKCCTLSALYDEISTPRDVDHSLTA